MPFLRISDHTDISFSTEKPIDYYKFFNLADLGTICYLTREESFKVHCIGIIYSEHGMFYIKSLPQHKLDITIKMSLINLSVPPISPNSPTTVQVFGDLIWKNRPVILARMLNYMPPNKAIMLDNSMRNIRKLYSANNR